MWILSGYINSKQYTSFFLNLETNVEPPSKTKQLGVHDLLWKCAICTIIYTFTLNYVHIMLVVLGGSTDVLLNIKYL